MEQESRKSATAHTVLGISHLENSKPAGTCRKPPRKKKCICVYPCKYSWKHCFGHTVEADHAQSWQQRSFLPKHLAFIWADTLSQAVYFMIPTCTSVPVPPCLWMLKNSKINLISSWFHLQCYKCREISVTWWNDWWVCTGVSESTAEHRENIHTEDIHREWQSDANASQNPCLCNGCPWALKHTMKILNTETFLASIMPERKKRIFQCPPHPATFWS